MPAEEIILYLKQFKLKLTLYKNPVHFNIDIAAENDLEKANVDAVIQSMEINEVPTIINDAIMPDACLTIGIETVRVGRIVVTRNAIHSEMYSVDIGCYVMLIDLAKIALK
ncbi:hypothetical protein [Tenacibaculum maritimum]|uniref:hypothetical protein n=1 Tax=Tenacibaculum maritimum TaxID=107401 RepID=UPI00191697B9|nr:hypothetical protein [Tenacibaculum maritimum]